MSSSGSPLSADERERFAAWLEAEAVADRLLLEQLEQFPAGAGVARFKRDEITAAELVAKKLRATEDNTL